MEISQSLGLCPDKLKAVFIRRIGESRFKLWFDQRVRFILGNDCLKVLVPNRHLLDWLNTRFRADLEHCAREVFEKTLKILFEIAEEKEIKAGEKGLTQVHLENGEQSQAPTPVQLSHDSSPRRKPAWEGFESFFPGENNRNSWETSRRFASGKAVHCNPLVLFGPSGCGKTHLLGAIYKEVKRNPALGSVHYLTAEDFTFQFVSAVQKGRVPSFRSKYHFANLLLLDDCQFLADKPATQKEFLLTMDGVLRHGGLLAVSLDGHPRLTKRLLPEIADRLGAGVVCPMVNDDSMGRKDFIQGFWRKLNSEPLPDDVVNFLLKKFQGNIRELQGLLRQVANQAAITSLPPNRDLVHRASAGYVFSAIRKWSMAEIEGAVCQLASLPGGGLRKPLRDRASGLWRSLAIYLCRKWNGATFRAIGIFFGNQNHSTVIAAEKRIQKLLEQKVVVSLGTAAMPLSLAISQVESNLKRAGG
ncbi:MAG: hypothetical protein EXR99_01045 [Gemmataceae bacterium]|nr:hypothetical protein [Gemmataceae bacterium]